jgi:hypothetical protein
MPSILTLEGPRLLGFGTPKLKLLRMNGAIGDAIGCAGCQPRGFGDAASDDLAHFNNALTAYMAQVAAVNKSSTWLGLIGGVAGVVAGVLISRRVSKRKYAKLGGAVAGGLGLGLGTFFASRSIMMPDFVAPQTTAQQLLTKDLTF